MLSHTMEHPVPRLPRFSPMPRLRERARTSLLIVIAMALSTAAYRARVADPRLAGAITEASPGTPFTSFGERRSHNGGYTAAIVDAAPVAVGAAQTWTLHLSRRARRVSHATVVASAWMPDDSTRSPVTPSVRYVGGGDYRIDGLYFTKPGWWNVALVVGGDRGIDSVAFNLILPHQP